MDHQRHLSQIDQTRADSRLWKRLAIGAFVVDGLLTLRIVTLDAREKTIVVPPVVSREFWVKGDQVSPSYLDAMARWYADLALTYSPSTVKGQGEVLLRYTDPRAHGALATRLLEDAEQVARNKVSEVFFPGQSRIRQESLEVALSGELVTFIGEQTTPARHVTYLVRFVSHDGQLSVASFTEAGNESDPFGDRKIVSPPAAAAVSLSAARE